MFTVVQRFRSDLGLYMHLHCLITDGAFAERDGDVRLLPAATPTAERLTTAQQRSRPPACGRRFS